MFDDDLIEQEDEEESREYTIEIKEPERIKTMVSDGKNSECDFKSLESLNFEPDTSIRATTTNTPILIQRLDKQANKK